MTTHAPFHAALRVWAALFAVLGWLTVVDQANAATPTHVQSRAQEITSGTANNLAFSASNTSGNLIVVYAIWSNTQPVTLSDTRREQLRQRGAGDPVEQRRLELPGVLRQVRGGRREHRPGDVLAVHLLLRNHLHTRVLGRRRD